MKIPLAEHFHSVQGEGQWVGTPMHFIRLPGCSVGRPIKGTITDEEGLEEIPVAGHSRAPTLPTGRPAWLCRRFDGTPFWCDTDFGRYDEIGLEVLFADTWENHICLTGGEPLMHREVVEQIRTSCFRRGIHLHIETSGTIDFWWERELGTKDLDPWLTVSPKQGWTPYMIHHANEVRLLISADHDMQGLVDPAFLQHPNVWVSPINEVNMSPIQGPALQKCYEILRQFPHWKLSVQLHKYLGVR